MGDLSRDVGSGSLLGTIGGLLTRHPQTVDLRPVLKEGTHEMSHLNVTTEHGTFTVRVEPVDE